MAARKKGALRMGLSVRFVRGLACCSVVLGGLLVVPMTLAVVTAYPAVAQTVQSIVVEGNRRVETDTIRSYFKPGPGGQLGPLQIDEGLKSLIATGLFTDVRISRPGGRIVVAVVEAQVINRVAFEGNKKAKDEQISAEIQSKPRGTLSRATVQSDVRRILEIYQRSGRYDVRIEPKIIELPNNRVDLVFEINEGQKTGIKQINFVGNRYYSSYRLKDVIKTSVSGWFSFLQTTDIYDPDRLEADRDLLRRFYLKHGFADVRILSAVGEYDPAAGGFAVTFTIDEGAQYRVGTVDITSNVRVLDAQSLRSRLKIGAGQVYNADAVEKSVEALTIEAAKRGYAFASVRPQGSRNFETKIINLTFLVEEGARAYIERINIRGNTRTRDYVIRREFDIGEGDAYNRALVDRAERRLNNLNYFKKVKVTNEPGSAPDRIVLNVDVEEKSTGNFSVGGGYSTNQGWLAELSVTETNLMGRGQYARAAVQYGEFAKGVELSFAEPYFLGYRVGAGIDLYAKQSLASSFILYNLDTIGANLRMSFPINEELSITPRYSIYQQEISLPNNTCPPAGSVDLRDCSSAAYRAAFAQGPLLTSMVGYTATYNTLDNNKLPTSGTYAELKQDFAGAGGDVNFFRTSGDVRQYMEVIPDVVGLLRFQGGIITGWGDTPLRATDHFQATASIMRGFAPGGIGPRDFFTNSDPGLGGTKYWAATAEAQTPLYFLPKEVGMRVAAFADVGSIWDYQGPTAFGCGGTPGPCTRVNLADSNGMNVRASGGVGILWESPLGPIRFDFAWPFMKEKYDQTQWFRFSGGTSF
jgi:outer membrane protein insertion porin family